MAVALPPDGNENDLRREGRTHIGWSSGCPAPNAPRRRLPVSLPRWAWHSPMGSNSPESPIRFFPAGIIESHQPLWDSHKVDLLHEVVPGVWLAASERPVFLIPMERGTLEIDWKMTRVRPRVTVCQEPKKKNPMGIPPLVALHHLLVLPLPVALQHQLKLQRPASVPVPDGAVVARIRHT